VKSDLVKSDSKKMVFLHTTESIYISAWPLWQYFDAKMPLSLNWKGPKG